MKDQNLSKDGLARRLQSHLINKGTFDKMLDDDLNGFLDERERLIKKEIKKLLFL